MSAAEGICWPCIRRPPTFRLSGGSQCGMSEPLLTGSADPAVAERSISRAVRAVSRAYSATRVDCALGRIRIPGLHPSCGIRPGTGVIR